MIDGPLDDNTPPPESAELPTIEPQADTGSQVETPAESTGAPPKGETAEAAETEPTPGPSGISSAISDKAEVPGRRTSQPCPCYGLQLKTKQEKQGE